MQPGGRHALRGVPRRVCLPPCCNDVAAGPNCRCSLSSSSTPCRHHLLHTLLHGCCLLLVLLLRLHAECSTQAAASSSPPAARAAKRACVPGCVEPRPLNTAAHQTGSIPPRLLSRKEPRQCCMAAELLCWGDHPAIGLGPCSSCASLRRLPPLPRAACTLLQVRPAAKSLREPRNSRKLVCWVYRPLHPG